MGHYVALLRTCLIRFIPVIALVNVFMGSMQFNFYWATLYTLDVVLLNIKCAYKFIMQ